MKTIGFIDYFLDEWHAEKYPGWIEEASNGRMKVTYAYGLRDKEGGRTNAEWCAAKGIQLLDSIEEVVAKSDCLIVLSPDHPEYHEELCQLPLRSGKPTYVDKTFAPDRQTALALFELADRHGTPMYSSSALRFASEYTEADRRGVEGINSIGPGRFDNYSIHQIEPILSLMGAGAKPKRVMYTGTAKSPGLLIQFEDGRQAAMNQLSGDCPFAMALNYESGNAKLLKVQSDFFGLFIRNMLTFFETGKPAVDPAETVAIITIIEYGTKAIQTPFQWVELPG